MHKKFAIVIISSLIPILGATSAFAATTATSSASGVPKNHEVPYGGTYKNSLPPSATSTKATVDKKDSPIKKVQKKVKTVKHPGKKGVLHATSTPSAVLKHAGR
jgi:peptidoglycan hydrolase CwlO-like protein